MARHAARKLHEIKLGNGKIVRVGQGPPQIVVEPSAPPPSASPPPVVALPPGSVSVPGAVMMDTLSLTMGLIVRLDDGLDWRVARVRPNRDGGRTVTLRRPGVKFPVLVPRDGLSEKMWRTGG